MPDYFVPLDTTRYTKFHRELSAKSIVINANLRYAEKNRKALLKLYGKEADPVNSSGIPVEGKGFKAFNENYQVPQSLLDDIYAEGKKQGVEPKDDDELQQTNKYLSMQLKALIARDLWSMSEYFRVVNEDADAIKCALDKLR